MPPPSSRSSAASERTFRLLVPATSLTAADDYAIELGGVRLPLVEVDDNELAELRRMLGALQPAVAVRD